MWAFFVFLSRHIWIISNGEVSPRILNEASVNHLSEVSSQNSSFFGFPFLLCTVDMKNGCSRPGGSHRRSTHTSLVVVLEADQRGEGIFVCLFSVDFITLEKKRRQKGRNKWKDVGAKLNFRFKRFRQQTTDYLAWYDHVGHWLNGVKMAWAKRKDDNRDGVRR